MSKVKDLYQLLLPSGRGVRVVELTPTEKDSFTRNAARMVDKGATVADFKLSELREGVMGMIKQVTLGKYKNQEELVATQPKEWKDVDGLDLAQYYDTYFTAKDDHVLTIFYRRLHEVSAEEIEMIVGKAQTVSGD